MWLPDERKVRRAPPTDVDGLFTPSYTRGNIPDQGRILLDNLGTPGPTIAATDHSRRGFTGLLERPNAWQFRFVRAQDVLAPINSKVDGYPVNKERSYGPSGLSLGNDRWEIRRAVVLQAVRHDSENRIRNMTLYIDALTQAPLYLITRRSNEWIMEVGIFMSRYSGDDLLHPRWSGSGSGFGAILPAAAAFTVAGEGGGWLRESFKLRSDPPTDKQRGRQMSLFQLQRGH